MILIIAENPSLARNIVAGIGGRMAKMSGYYEGEGFLVTWAFGHLFSLCDIEDYEENPPETVRWTMDNLPCFPEKFKFVGKFESRGAQQEPPTLIFEFHPDWTKPETNAQ